MTQSAATTVSLGCYCMSSSHAIIIILLATTTIFVAQILMISCCHGKVLCLNTYLLFKLGFYCKKIIIFFFRYTVYTWNNLIQMQRYLVFIIVRKDKNFSKRSSEGVELLKKKNIKQISNCDNSWYIWNTYLNEAVDIFWIFSTCHKPCQGDI